MRALRFVFLLLTLIAALLLGAACISAGELTQRVWAAGRVIDQGDDPSCVGAAWQGWLEAEPYAQYGPYDDQIYYQAKLRDIEPGEDYDGTWANAGAEYLQQMGYISQWRFAQDAADVRWFVLTTGPVVVSLPWWSHGPSVFQDLSADGYLIPGTSFRGFHAVYCPGWLDNPVRDGLYCQNSWGPYWGVWRDPLDLSPTDWTHDDRGHFYIHSWDLQGQMNLGLLGVILPTKAEPQMVGDQSPRARGQ